MQRLRVVLQRRISVVRPRSIIASAEARGHGVLNEIAEYHAAIEQLGFIEGRFAEFVAKLSFAQFIVVSSLNANG